MSPGFFAKITTPPPSLENQQTIETVAHACETTTATPHPSGKICGKTPSTI